MPKQPPKKDILGNSEARKLRSSADSLDKKGTHMLNAPSKYKSLGGKLSKAIDNKFMDSRKQIKHNQTGRGLINKAEDQRIEADRLEKKKKK